MSIAFALRFTNRTFTDVDASNLLVSRRSMILVKTVWDKLSSADVLPQGNYI